jgi:hypothetical protein
VCVWADKGTIVKVELRYCSTQPIHSYPETVSYVPMMYLAATASCKLQAATVVQSAGGV